MKKNLIAPLKKVNTSTLEGEHKKTNQNVAIIAGKFNSSITNQLLEGALSALKDVDITPMITWVPGAFEIPVTIAKNLKKFNGFIALGCVIKGQTPHFDFISKSTTDALMTLSITSKKPVGNGVITCLNKKQALKRGKKGSEAAEAVLSVLFQ